jgi:hypothetical protein
MPYKANIKNLYQNYSNNNNKIIIDYTYENKNVDELLY